MDAYEFGKPDNIGNIRPAFILGIDAAEMAKALRRLADRIESGDVAVQTGTVYTLADAEDFVRSAMVLKFAEKR
jgi:hypothetical protein